MAKRALADHIYNENKYIILGTIIYLIGLLIVFPTLFQIQNYYNVDVSYQILDRILPVCLPAIPAAFIPSMCTKKFHSGFLSVLIPIYFIVIFIFLIIGFFSVFPNISYLLESEAQGLRTLLLLFLILGIILILPIIVLSGIFTVISSFIGCRMGLLFLEK
jgi:hypothetical protein